MNFFPLIFIPLIHSESFINSEFIMLNASCIIKHFVFRNTLCVKLVCKQFHTSKRSYILSKIEVIWKMTIFWLFFSQKSQIFEFGCADRRPLRSNLIQTRPITYASFETHPVLISWKLKKKQQTNKKCPSWWRIANFGQQKIKWKWCCIFLSNGYSGTTFDTDP